jgi:hypothetical protein
MNLAIEASSRASNSRRPLAPPRTAQIALSMALLGPPRPRLRDPVRIRPNALSTTAYSPPPTAPDVAVMSDTAQRAAEEGP